MKMAKLSMKFLLDRDRDRGLVLVWLGRSCHHFVVQKEEEEG
jgi:hypothetical protein